MDLVDADFEVSDHIPSSWAACLSPVAENEEIRSIPTEERVCAQLASQHVVPITTAKEVVAKPAQQPVIARLPFKDVIPDLAIEYVSHPA